MKLIIDIPEEVKHKVYAHGLSLCPNDKEQLINAIMNGTPIPDNATNEDVNVNVYEHNGGDTYSVKNEYNFNAITWWDTPYQKGGKE